MAPKSSFDLPTGARNQIREPAVVGNRPMMHFVLFHGICVLATSAVAAPVRDGERKVWVVRKDG